MAFEVGDDRVDFGLWIDAHTKVVERILNGRFRSGTSRQEHHATQPETHARTVRGSAKKANRQDERDDLDGSRLPERLGGGGESRAGSRHVVDEQNRGRAAQWDAGEGPPKIAKTRRTRKPHLPGSRSNAAQAAQPQRDAECASHGPSEKRGLVVAAGTTAAPMKRYRNDGVDPLGYACCLLGEPSPKRTGELGAVFELEALNRVGHGTLVLEDRASIGRAVDQRRARSAEARLLDRVVAGGASFGRQQLDHRFCPPTHDSTSAAPCERFAESQALVIVGFATLNGERAVDLLREDETGEPMWKRHR